MICQVHKNNITLCQVMHEQINVDCQLSVLKISHTNKEHFLTCQGS